MFSCFTRHSFQTHSPNQPKLPSLTRKLAKSSFSEYSSPWQIERETPWKPHPIFTLHKISLEELVPKALTHLKPMVKLPFACSPIISAIFTSACKISLILLISSSRRELLRYKVWKASPRSDSTFSLTNVTSFSFSKESLVCIAEW